MPVVISKKERPSRVGSYSLRKFQTSWREIISYPLAETIFILSLKSSRWGDVYRPILLAVAEQTSPPAAKAEASMLQTLPLPLVPAT